MGIWLRGVPHGGLSFVPGHAIITFAIAGLLVMVPPRRWGIVALVLASLNALARVYLDAHNPLDVARTQGPPWAVDSWPLTPCRSSRRLDVPTTAEVKGRAERSAGGR
jgi:hypothetical protein